MVPIVIRIFIAINIVFTLVIIVIFIAIIVKDSETVLIMLAVGQFS